MKKLTSFLLTAAMLTATTSQIAFADALTTAQTAASKITAGTVILAADTTLNGRNDATQYQKTQAVENYVKNFLMADLSGVSADVTFDDGDYIIALKDANSNTASKTISADDFEFVYTVKAINDDFSYINEDLNLDSEQNNDVDITAFANVLEGAFSRKVVLPTKFDSPISTAANRAFPDAIAIDGNLMSVRTYQQPYEIYIKPAPTAYYKSDIGENYIFETTFMVQDRITDEYMEEYYPAANRLSNIGVDFWSAMMTVSNRAYEMSFTPENDGLYYKTVDTDGTTAKWAKLAMVGDNNMHNYRAIVNGSKAELYIDGVFVVEWTMPASDTREIKFSANIGAVMDVPYDMLETKLDCWSLYNVYENQVFIEDFTSLDNVYTMSKNNGEAYYELVNNINPAKPGEHVNSKYVLDGMFNIKPNNATDPGAKFLFYKVPKNSKITNVKVYGLRTAPYYMSFQRYGYAADEMKIMEWANPMTNPSGAGQTISFVDAYANPAIGRMVKVSDEIKAVLKDDDGIKYDVIAIAYADNSKEATMAELNYDYYNGIAGVEIEYEYFYDDLDDDNTEIAFADNLTSIVPTAAGQQTDPSRIMGWVDPYGQNPWQFDGVEIANQNTATTWNAGRWTRMSTKYGKDAGGVELTPHQSDWSYANIFTNAFEDVGANYIFRSEVFLNRSVCKGGEFYYNDQNGNVDGLMSVYNNGYTLSFAPHWDGTTQKFAYADSTGLYQLIDLPAGVTITDNAFNEYKAVVNNDIATVYINGVAVNTWQMPTYNPETMSPMIYFYTVGTLTAGASKMAVRNVVVAKGQEKVVELIDGISGIGNASYLGEDTSSIMVTFDENKVGKEFNAYCVQYDSEGKLTSVEIANVPTTGSYDLFIIPADATGYHFYFWDANMNPVYEALYK